MKRCWSQLHLSTCVVLMFVAGTLLWVNMTPVSPTQPPQRPDIPAHLTTTEREIETLKHEIAVLRWKLNTQPRWGWPCTAIEYGYKHSYKILSPLNLRGVSIDGVSTWNWWAVAINVGSAFGICACVAALCELLTRRRETRKSTLNADAVAPAEIPR